MAPAEIAEERRRGRYAGIAAIAAGILFPAGLVWAQTINNDLPEDDTSEQLHFFDRHADDLVAASVLRSVSLLLLVVVAVHLYRATKARNPATPSIVRVMGVAGPLALAIGGLVHDIGLATEASDFSDRRFPTATAEEQAADDVTKSPFQLVTLGLSLGGTFALGFWFVLGSLNAMRVGLLSRFMGVLGIIIGPLFLFPFPPFVMAFWLIAVGALLLRYWPRGIPPAWDAGEAVPWASAREQGSEQVEVPGGSRNGEVDPVGPSAGKADGER